MGRGRPGRSPDLEELARVVELLDALVACKAPRWYEAYLAAARRATTFVPAEDHDVAFERRAG